MGDTETHMEIAIVYAYNDNQSPEPNERWLDRIQEHLAPLVLRNQITAWSDMDIRVGEKWDEHIRKNLHACRIVIVLCSPAFFASEYVKNSELPILLKRAEEDGVKILPIILSPCGFDRYEFNYPDPQKGPSKIKLSTFQAANRGLVPLRSMNQSDQDQVLDRVAEEVQQAITNP